MQGHHSYYGDALDQFLLDQAAALKGDRRNEFLSTLDYDGGMMSRLQRFDQAEEQRFRSHGWVPESLLLLSLLNLCTKPSVTR